MALDASTQNEYSLVLSYPNVVGVGVGEKVTDNKETGLLGYVVMVEEKIALSQLPSNAILPKMIGATPVDVVQVGKIKALTTTDRHRPAFPGISIGHVDVTAGTFGAVVRDVATGERLILSNNHVMANCNDANIGDPIIQPGSYDGGTLKDDLIATLLRFIPISFNDEGEMPNCNIATAYAKIGNKLAKLVRSQHRVYSYIPIQATENTVDAAVARPISGDIIHDDIKDIGHVSGVVDVALGQSVRKSGRTTGYTEGEVTILNAVVQVQYSSTDTATFYDQIITTDMSQGGDSGSLLVDGQYDSAVGLLFAGSDTVTIHNPIKSVLRDLNVTI